MMPRANFQVDATGVEMWWGPTTDVMDEVEMGAKAAQAIDVENHLVHPDDRGDYLADLTWDLPGWNFLGGGGPCDHRTVGTYRAWCFDCTCWCSPRDLCPRCELAALKQEPMRCT